MYRGEKNNIKIYLLNILLMKLLLLIKLNNCYDNYYQTNSNENFDKFWSRIQDIKPPLSSSNSTNNNYYTPKYVFKGLKDRILLNNSNSSVHNNSNNKNSNENNNNKKIVKKIDDKSLWNISSNDEFLSSPSPIIYSNYIKNDNNESEVITNNRLNASDFNLTKSLSDIDNDDSYEITNNNKAIILSSKETDGISGSETKFPIYFTNPATGIIYAIHPVGSTSPTSSSSLSSSYISSNYLNHYNSYDRPHHYQQHQHQQHHQYPSKTENFTTQMYVTKAEYERKIHLLKKRYRERCKKLKQKLLEQNKKWKAAIIRNNIINSNKITSTNIPPYKKVQKNKNKTVVKYTDPLIVEAIDTVLDSVYDHVTDAVTTKKVIKNKNQKKKKKNSKKRRKSTKRKKLVSRITTTTTTTTTPKIPIDDNLFDDPVIEQSQEQIPESLIRPWHHHYHQTPSPLSSSVTLPSTFMHESYEDDDAFDYGYNDEFKKRYVLISSAATATDTDDHYKSELTTFIKHSNSTYDNEMDYVPIPLTSAPIKRKKIQKRSIPSTHATTKNSNNSPHNKSNSNNDNKNKNFEKSKKLITEKNSKTSTVKTQILTTTQIPVATSSISNVKSKKKRPFYENTDYYFDFDDLIYNDYEYPDEENLNDLKQQNYDSKIKKINKNEKSHKSDFLSIDKVFYKNRRRKKIGLQKQNLPDYDDSDDYSYYDYDYTSSSAGDSIFSYVTDFFSSIQNTVSRFLPDTKEFSLINDLDPNEMDNIDDDNDNGLHENDIRKPKRPKPVIVVDKKKDKNIKLIKDKLNKNDDENNDSNNGIGSWFTSWFGTDYDETESSEIIEENLPTDEESNNSGSGSWFDSWFGTDEKTTGNEEDDDNGQWLFGWFDTESKKSNTKSKLTSAATTAITTTFKPILTVSDPMIYPQKWIGIIAQHILNSSSTTTTKTPIAGATTAFDTAVLSPSSGLASFIEFKIPKKISYDKHQIWRLKLNKEIQLQTLEKYKSSEDGSKLQWLIGPSLRGLNDVVIPPKLIKDFKEFLKLELIAYEVLIFDLGKAIQYENSKDNLIKSQSNNKYSTLSLHTLTWKKYHSYDEIVNYLEFIHVKNRNFIDLLHIGRSYEGRPLIVVKISSNNHYDIFNNNNKNDGNYIQKKKKKKTTNYRSSILLEAGVHGREWIGPSTATWIINELVKIMKNNQTTPISDTIKKITWYIIPVLNPDGYTYSQEYDRLWKKSRSKNYVRSNGLLTTAINWLQQSNSPKKLCYGVDLNRNWDYEWSSKIGGSSKSPCNEFFAGYTAFSEPETKSFSKFLLDYRKEIKLFISLHSYGQVISYPNRIKGTFAQQKLEDLLDVAMVGIDELRKSGSKIRYKIDSSNDMVSKRSGSSDYFAMNVAGIPYTYTIHLNDNGVHGYLLPGSYIESTSKDAFKIIKAMANYIF